MPFFEEFSRLEPLQTERFKAVISRLLAGEIVTPGEALRPDPDWRFAETYSDLLDGYLRMGGWRLELDRTLRLCRAIHESGQQRVRFNKLESLVLCMLRLMYHEDMQQASGRATCEVTTGAIRERLIQAGKPAHQLSRGNLAEAIRRLSRAHLVGVERGFEGTDPEKVTILPVVEKVLPPDRIQALAELTQAYLSERSATPNEGVDGPPDDEMEPMS